MNNNAKWISHPKLKDEAVYFRKEFNLEDIPTSADIDICGLGCYELFINGKKADDRLLTPIFSSYEQQVFYDTYDIKKLLKKGRNVLGVILGNGFYNNNIPDVIGFDRAEWNSKPKLICDLKTNGKSVVLSDKSFKVSAGAIVFNAMRVGEIYDARKETDWNKCEFDASDWISPDIVRPPGGTLEPSDNLPIRIIDTIEVKDSWSLSEKTTVYDFGQNMSGFIYMKGEGKPGSEIVFEYAEILGENGDIDTKAISKYVLYPEFQTDKYIFSDKKENGWHPKFTYHGFRYVKVTNKNNAKIELKACLLCADLKKAGYFECSNELLNKLQHNTVMSTITNYHYAPTDCPHREKLAWTGDAQISSEHSLFNFDIKDYYLQWMKMFPPTQRKSGLIPATLPRPGYCFTGHDGPVWDSAIFIIPWNIYLYTKDKRAIEVVYESCKRYMNYIYSISDNYVVSMGHGDWSTAINAGEFCDDRITVTAYYYIIADCMCNFAKILGNEADFKKYSEVKAKVKKAYQQNFIKNGDMTDKKQCAYAITLANNLQKDEDTVSLENKLVEAVFEKDCHIDGGILCAKYLLCVLSQIGRHDLAMKIALQEDLPGWGYSVKQGATTLWECWDGHDSQNHHMFGTISEWFYKYILGLKVVKPGFSEFEISPEFAGLSYARGYHKTRQGEIKIEWEKNKDEVIYKLTIPECSKAKIVSPKGYVCDKTELSEGQHKLFFVASDDNK